MTSARDLADRLHRRWLEENPFAATMYGVPGYDDLVPDDSEEGQQAWRAEVGRFLAEADVIANGQLTPAEAVTLDCAKAAAAQERDGIDLAGDEHTVTAMQYAGPAAFLAVAARTVLVDQAAAEAYLTRLRRSGAGLYANEHGLLGSFSTSLMRAARLVVDTGIHAFGWSRERALDFLVAHVPMPREFLAAETDRYVVMPGQALAYLTGKLEILRIRDEARERLGPAFSLPAFHGAVLDHGSLPMPTLARSIAGWLDQSVAAQG